MKRRDALLAAGVAGAAVAAGVGWSLRRSSPADPGPGMIWTLDLERPDGGRQALADWRGQPLVINFWATWCEPCLREMPALDRFAKEFGSRGWRVVGVAIDQAAPVKAFLARTPVSFPIVLGGPGGLPLTRALGNEVGGLPFTAVLSAAGQIIERKTGESTYDGLAAIAAKA